MSNNLLELKNITKVYPNGVVANKNVNFSLKKGEIHAICGENGAGKSTLMKMLFGMEQPSEGEIILRGEKITIDTPQKAIDFGIGMVHQHFMLVPSFTVAQNLLLGIEPKKGTSIDMKKTVSITEDISKKYNLAVNPNLKVQDLSVGMKQKVEILKALLRGAKILILDEPTAVLTPQETEELFIELKKLRDEGHTIIFISHKLKEVKAICDRITIIRKGQTKGVFNTADVTEQEISKLMVGRDVILKYDKKINKVGSPVLRVENLCYKNENNKEILKNINFTVNSGKIVGIAGVEGNGQSELISLITGSEEIEKGRVLIKNKEINNLTIKEKRNLGLSYVPEDRMSQGVAKEASIKENIISNRIFSQKFKKGVFLDTKKLANLSTNLIEEYLVKCNGSSQKIKMLSGGNIQKVVVARECSIGPDLLVAEQPTRGVDIGAAQFIHKQLIKMRDDNKAILLVSADLNEVMELSDNLLVMYEGEIVAYFDNLAELTEEELGLCMLGIKRQSSEEIRRAAHE